MRKTLLTILMVALLIGTVQAANRFGDTYHEIQVKDETGRKVTDITNLFIYLAGTTTNATIYSDKARQNTITIPMTEASTNTTLLDGLFTWWGPDTWDFSMTNTDSVGPMTNAGHADRTSNEGTLVFPSYLQSISSTSYDDSQTITMGTGSDWVLQAGNVANQMSFTPAEDNSNFIIGTNGTALNSSFNVYMGASLGLKIDSTGPTFTWDGGIANINASSNFATNINTGTSTGAVNIGNSASGAWVLDGTSTGIITADAKIDIQTADASGDIDIDAVLGSVIVDGGEAAADAVTVAATAGAGGVIVSCGTGDITLDSGDDIFLAADTGTGDVISLINTQGTAAGAVIVRTVAAGSIDIDSGDNITVDVADNYTLDTADGKISLIADGASDGDIELNAEDDLILTTTGKLTITNTEAMTVSGTMDIAGTITMAEDEVISNAVDDTVSVTSNDEAMTFQILGATGNKSAILSIDADLAADNADTWTHTVADGGAYTIANEGTATMTIQEAVTITGALTMSGGQTRTVVPEVVVDGTVPPSLTAVGTSGQSQIPVWSFDANPDATGDDYVFILWRVPVGYVVDSADLFFTFSYSTAETDGDDVVFDITVLALTPGSGAAGGTAFDAAGSAVAALDVDLVNGDGDEGKIMEGTFDIEVTAIAAGDEVLIAFWVDESESDLAASGTIDIHKWTITYESTE